MSGSVVVTAAERVEAGSVGADRRAVRLALAEVAAVGRGVALAGFMARVEAARWRIHGAPIDPTLFGPEHVQRHIERHIGTHVPGLDDGRVEAPILAGVLIDGGAALAAESRTSPLSDICRLAGF